ncbi:hypothetical protein QTN25_005324 [Entamoeba marina]
MKADKLFRMCAYIYVPFLCFGFYGMTLICNGTNWLPISKELCCAGYILFLVSDSILCYSVLSESTKTTKFLIMSTYFVAQLLITYGYVMGVSNLENVQ